MIPNTFSLTQVNNFANQISVTGTSTGDIVVAAYVAKAEHGTLLIESPAPALEAAPRRGASA